MFINAGEVFIKNKYNVIYFNVKFSDDIFKKEKEIRKERKEKEWVQNITFIWLNGNANDFFFKEKKITKYRFYMEVGTKVSSLIIQFIPYNFSVHF